MLKFLHTLIVSWTRLLVGELFINHRRNLLLRDQRLEQATIERKHNFASILTFCLRIHEFSEIKLLIPAVYREHSINNTLFISKQGP